MKFSNNAVRSYTINKRKRYLMEREDIKFITGEIHFLELVEKKSLKDRMKKKLAVTNLT